MSRNKCCLLMWYLTKYGVADQLSNFVNEVFVCVLDIFVNLVLRGWCFFCRRRAISSRQRANHEWDFRSWTTLVHVHAAVKKCELSLTLNLQFYNFFPLLINFLTHTYRYVSFAFLCSFVILSVGGVYINRAGRIQCTPI